MINNIQLRNENISNVNTALNPQVQRKQEVKKVQELNSSEKKESYNFERFKNEDSFSAKEFEDNLKKINDDLLKNNLALNYKEDKELKKVIVTLTNTETQEIIRQIPAEEILRVYKYIKDSVESYDKKGNKETIASFSTIINEYA